MNYGLYVIYDSIAKESGFPFEAKNDLVAYRKFSSFVTSVSKETAISEDEFILKKIGEYDSDSCEIVTAHTEDVDPLSVGVKVDE